MMKTKIGSASLIALFAFALGMGFNSIVFSDAISDGGIKIGVVDVNKVVNDSSQVKALKKQQEQKKAELVKWLSTANADIQKQTTEENKTKLSKKYSAELAKKQKANQDEYVKKITEIDANISKVIGETAKAQGYTVLFSKNSVLYGGDDLTAAVSKTVK